MQGHLQTHKMSTSFIILLSLLTALDALAIDIYVPAFPVLATSLQVSTSQIQQTLSIFLVGLAVGQGLYGPFLDRFGRRIPLLIGLIIFILGSLLAAVATSLELLLFARFLQAIGAASGLVTPRAIISDICNEQDAARHFSVLMQVMMVIPIIAPLVGSQLLNYGTWHIIFYTLALLSFMLLVWSSISVPETLALSNRQPLNLKNIFKNYYLLCRNKSYFSFTLAGGFLLGGFFFYISNSPYIFIQHYSVSPEHYSYLFALNALCFIIFGQLSIWLLNRGWSAYQVLKLGSIILMFFTLMLSLVTLLYTPSLWVYTLLLTMVISSTGLLFGNLTALTMQQVQHHLAGIASALIGLLQYSFGAVIGFIASLATENILVLPVTLLICAFSMIILNTIAHKNA